MGSQVVTLAQSFIGVPYLWGGTTPSGFDCSGLVQYVFNKLGISLPRTSQEQAGSGTNVDKADLQAGDLVFYNEPGEGPNSHVAIYVGGGQTIDAPHTGAKVRYDSVDWSHFSGARRVTAGGGSGSSSGSAGLQPQEVGAGVLGDTCLIGFGGFQIPGVSGLLSFLGGGDGGTIGAFCLISKVQARDVIGGLLLLTGGLIGLVAVITVIRSESPKQVATRLQNQALRKEGRTPLLPKQEPALPPATSQEPDTDVQAELAKMRRRGNELAPRAKEDR